MPGGGHSPGQNFNADKPDGNTYLADGDNDIRDNQKHFDNALAVEHYSPTNDPDASEDDFGRHDFITLKEQGSKPDLTGSTNRHGFYAKSTGIYYEKSDGTEICILLFSSGRSGVDADIPSGQTILFESNTAVTGYSLLTNKDDGLVYFTKGTVAGGEEGGTDVDDGTWTIAGLANAAVTLTAAQSGLSAHTHGIPFSRPTMDSSGSTPSWYAGTGFNDVTGAISGGPQNAGSSHNHTPSHDGTWRPPGRNFTRQTRS